jgi:hypothetical protein
MIFPAWLGEHWFELLQTASILVGVFTAVHSIREDTKERRIENLFTLTNGHREIWSKLYERDELSRVLAPKVNLERDPITHEEELFIHTLILHLRAAFKARDLGMQFDDDAVGADIRQFFTRTIPRKVWERSKVFQDPEFVAFVEGCLNPERESERVA